MWIALRPRIAPSIRVPSINCSSPDVEETDGVQLVKFS